jgi:hypothetical protein
LGAAAVKNFAPFGSAHRKIGFPGNKGCTPNQGGAGWRSNFDARRKFFAGPGIAMTGVAQMPALISATGVRPNPE